MYWQGISTGCKTGPAKIGTLDISVEFTGKKFYMREVFSEVEHNDGQRNEEKLPDIKVLWAKVPIDGLY